MNLTTEEVAAKASKYWIQHGIAVKHKLTGQIMRVYHIDIDRIRKRARSKNDKEHFTRMNGIWCEWTGPDGVQHKQRFKSNELAPVTHS